MRLLKEFFVQINALHKKTLIYVHQIRIFIKLYFIAETFRIEKRRKNDTNIIVDSITIKILTMTINSIQIHISK
mgnify:CR=1 FL=1